MTLAAQLADRSIEGRGQDITVTYFDGATADARGFVVHRKESPADVRAAWSRNGWQGFIAPAPADHEQVEFITAPRGPGFETPMRFRALIVQRITEHGPPPGDYVRCALAEPEAAP
ncbi:MAG: hypothetical protein OXI20_10440 [Rhodospirillales bacterium]|nr:hypothetical protein [Rhodospirillales bacterium]